MSTSLPRQLSFTQRVMNAGVWSLTGYGLAQVIRFSSNLLMTRLLMPETFGVMAIASMVLVCLAMFSDMGLSQNVIQSRRGHEPTFLNTVWVTQIVRGLVLWLIACAISAALAGAIHARLVPPGSVYSEPHLPIVILVLSTAVIIAGFQSTKMAEATRNLALGRVTRNAVTAQLIGFLCMLLWSSFDRSIWALVAGNLCAQIATTLLSHLALPGVTNRWQWDKPAFQEIFHFGKWVFVSSVLGFLASNGDRLLLGGFVNSYVLGVYVIAYLIYTSIEQVISRLVIDVSFPAFSEVARERRQLLKRSYYRFHAAVASFAYACAGALIVSGPTLIGMLYDQRYEQAGWMLQILALALATAPFRLAGHCLLALGLPKLLSHLVAMRAVSLFMLAPLGFYLFGLTGAIWAIVLSYFSSVPATIYYMIKYELIDLPKEAMVLPVWIVGMLIGEAFNLAIGSLR